ncbi:hypothetical protein [Microbacterium karelineae]|uniref:hypothetical protein n=1 Tax=Microbacterium karelineae TaxID=2654283 RepID=UPI0012E9D951|nr:hypothetical protein [Microbacterium karelineae]
MSQSGQSAPRSGSGIIGRIARSQGLLLPWTIAFLFAVVVTSFAPIDARWGWISPTAGVCVIVALVVQIIIGRADGFILRTATAALGSVLIVGIVSLVGALFTAVAAGLSLFPDVIG